MNIYNNMVGNKAYEKIQSSKTYIIMSICTYMDMDVMIHQKIGSLKKLNKLVDLIENLCNKTYVSISNMFLKIIGVKEMNHEFEWPSTNRW
jgi:hypothetical protein